jgi:hypothetical protein
MERGDQIMAAITGRIALVSVFSAFLGLSVIAAAPRSALAFEELERTVNRTPLGVILYPKRIFVKPEHYEFLPLVSNQDPQNQHPAAWDGQDWDDSQWGPDWTPAVALQKFFQARIFEHQYETENAAVVELGPTFYKLSDLDRRRTLKLLSTQMGFFKKGYGAVELVDWSTHAVVGAYTPKGLFLN